MNILLQKNGAMYKIRRNLDVKIGRTIIPANEDDTLI